MIVRAFFKTPCVALIRSFATIHKGIVFGSAPNGSYSTMLKPVAAAER